MKLNEELAKRLKFRYLIGGGDGGGVGGGGGGAPRVVHGERDGNSSIAAYVNSKERRERRQEQGEDGGLGQNGNFL